jgi:poly(3-hydroxybutyrate) depolymerase
LLSSKGYIHGMEDANLIAKASDDYNAVIMYPIPKARWGGLLRTWNTPDGAVSMFGTRAHDDSAYMNAAMQKTIERANVDPNKVFGFGYDHGGTMLQYQVGVSAPGTFKDIAVYSSTVSPRVPMPKEGTGIQVAHSANDPTLGWNGDRGGIAAIPEKFGYTNLTNSQPFAQAPRVAEVNGVTTTPAWQSVNPEYDMRTWMSGDRAIAQEIRFNRSFHGVPGRAIGGSNESFTSSEALQGMPPPVSAVDLSFGHFFGLKKVGAAAETTVGA